MIDLDEIERLAREANYIAALNPAAVLELVGEVRKWKRAFEIKSKAANRYLPCPDCRDKVEAGDCQRCRRQAAERQRDDAIARAERAESAMKRAGEGRT